MKNIELLAPAGDQESLIAAIQNGANAIYLGGTLFNARAFAKNFDDEQIKWAVGYAHARNVRIFVTVNTLFKDSEFIDLISYIDRLYLYQVDALIIQDIGLFHIVKERYPDFEIHISTQASVMNDQAVSYFEKNGANRIVLARENSIEEIKNICKSTKLDVEVFVHGALCVAYSGQCLMSSFIGKRSGNRGQCAQPCRLQYRLKKDGEILPVKNPFLMSPKDLMTIESIGELIDAGVTSFKIEGRMKRPEYVASVVKAYRKAIDAYIENEKIELDEDIQDMRAMFNRDYTTGYIFHDHSIVEGDYSGNKGIIIGQVIGYSKRNKLVKVKLTNSLRQGDSVVFERIDKGRPVNKIYVNNQLVSHANKGDIVEIEFDYSVYEGNVRKTVDTEIIKKLRKTFEKENIHLPLFMTFKGHVNEQAQLKIKYCQHEVTIYSNNVLEKALKTSLDKERIIKQLSKLGQTPFKIEKIDIQIDSDIIMPIKDLNEMRRQAINQLLNLIMSKKIHNNKFKEISPLKIQKKSSGNTQIYILVQNLDQLNICLEYNNNICIYYPFQADFEEAYQRGLKCNKEIGMFVPRICKNDDLLEIINHPLYKKVNNFIVNDYGALNILEAANKNIIIGTGLNIYNSFACEHFSKYKKILSLEMSKKEINSLNTNLNDCIVQIYGKFENMISEYCPISQYYFGYQNKNCKLCKNAKFTILDRKNEEFDLLMDEKCRMHLLNSKTLWIEQFDKIKTSGLFLHFTNEQVELMHDILNEFFNKITSKKHTNIEKEISVTTAYFKD